MPDANCENLFSVVQELWPTGRMTLAGFEAIWQRDLRHYDNLEVARRLKAHRADEPDATKPVWKSVVDSLRSHRVGPRKVDRLRIHLTNTRRCIDKTYAQLGAKRYAQRPQTDAEVFDNFMRANSGTCADGGWSRGDGWRCDIIEDGGEVPDYVLAWCLPENHPRYTAEEVLAWREQETWSKDDA